MKAWVIERVEDVSIKHDIMRLIDLPIPDPRHDEIRIKVLVCGICHTELDEIEGRTPPVSYPMVPGHQIVGVVDEVGRKVIGFQKGDRVGVAWIGSSCGECEYCKSGFENLCDSFVAMGRDIHGGYAEFAVVRYKFTYHIPEPISSELAAPLLCAGAIGYRSLKLSNISNGQSLGLTGFGASAHLVLKTALEIYKDIRIYVFARKEEERKFALELGAYWVGGIEDQPDEKLDAIIDTTPVWLPVFCALKVLKPGGRLVINAIRKESVDSDILSHISYKDQLWMEKEIKSVANITSKDVRDFLCIAANLDLTPEYTLYPFSDANQALYEMKTGANIGAGILDLRA